MPPIAAEPIVADGVVQVSVTSAPALADGGVLFTLTTTTSVAVHPAALVTVKVYVVVTFAEHVGDAIFEALKPVAGLQEYVLPPIAAVPTVADGVVQLRLRSGPALATGIPLTTTVFVATRVGLVQPTVLVTEA